MGWAGSRWRWLRGQSAADTSGATAIEAAIATPVLLILAVGAAEFGNMLYNANLIQTGLRDAARYLARVDDPVAAEPSARNLAVTGTISGEAPPRVAWWAAGDVVVSYREIANLPDDGGARAFRGGDTLTLIQVATEVDYGGLGTLGVFGRDWVRLAFSHEERAVGN